MDRRYFLKAGLAASATLVASASLPIASLAKGGAILPTDLDDLAGKPGLPSACRANDACVVVDEAIFADNIKLLKEDIGPDVKLCIVMKSDAYGHGVENFILEALRARPSHIAMVCNADMRKAVACMEKTGLRTPILRISPATFYEAAEALLNNWPVEELIGSLGQAEMLSRLVRRVGEKRGRKLSIPVHVNVDTGMGRMGFVRVEDARKAMALPGLEVRGIMTHYANAYDPDPKRAMELTRKQLDRFDAFLAELDLPDNVIVHTANSAAALCFPWTRRDMVRVGGALYGDLSEEMNPDGRYKRTMPLFLTSVVWVQEVPPGTTVSYDSVYRTPEGRNSILATVRIGYNNGAPSWLYEKDADILIRGRRFPVVGKVCMNMLVVNVTGQPANDKVRLGDEAVILGRQGGQEITWEEMEKKTGVPTCELMLDIGNENARISARSADHR